MLTPRLTNCAECEDICSLIESIDCKVAEMSVSLYNNVVFMLNKSFNHEVLSDLLNYKRILRYKICNPNYAKHFTVNMIASKVRRFTSGCIKDCSCRTSGAGIIITTTSTSTVPPTTTTTSTTIVPTTTTTTTAIPCNCYTITNLDPFDTTYAYLDCNGILVDEVPILEGATASFCALLDWVNFNSQIVDNGICGLDCPPTTTTTTTI